MNNSTKFNKLVPSFNKIILIKGKIMSLKSTYRLIGTIVFLISATVLFLTVQPSVSFWDPGEISAASYSLQVPHPPGGPLWLIIGRFFSMIPFAHNIGYRINTVSVLAGAFSVLILYLSAVKLIESYRGKNYKDIPDALITYISAATGALAFAFCDTFWFNAVESNYFAVSTLLFSLVVWLMMDWYEKADVKSNEKYIILMAYLIGLSTGVHLMSVLAVLTFISVVVMRKYVTDDEMYKKSAYLFLIHIGILLVIAIGLWASQTSTIPPTSEQFHAFDSKFKWIMLGVSAIFMGASWKKVFNRNSFYVPLMIGAVVLAVAYPGVVKIFPSFLLAIGGPDVATNLLILVIILAVLIYVTFWSAKKNKQILHVASLSLLFTLLGFTTYAMIIIRSSQHTPMNENSPDNFKKLMYYLGREQYGDFPIFERRFSQEPNQQGIYTNYSSDLDFIWRYQLNHMFNRYLLWNFAGKISTNQDAGVKWSQLYGIPFLIGLLGLYFHFRKDWKMASAWLILFIFMGYLIAFYQNQQQPQPRDRFYFYPGAFFVFAVWIAIGIREIAGLIIEKIKNPSTARTAVFACLGLGLLLIPGNMLRTNYFSHDRSHNWLPWDFSYNLLQSCKPNAILFTNGDNDTFPLWYLQDVEGVRQDIRVVCLSLANTDWYNLQLKNNSPYGAMKVKFGMSNDEIKQLQPIQWQPQVISIPVSKEAIKEFNVTDTSVIKNGDITFTMNNTLQFGDVKAIRIQDQVVLDIVKNNLWDRPIYFASTCSQDCFIGMDNYLDMEGLASRLVPEKLIGANDVNPDITYKDLFDINPSYSKTYLPGFKFRGVNDKRVFFDETETRLIQNYRNVYVRLAYYYLNVAKNDSLCIATLDQMDKIIPKSNIDIDYRFLYDIGNLYYAAGDTSKYKLIAADVEKQALQNLDVSANDLQSPYNAYSILERIYVNLKEYDKAIGILQRLETYYPNAGGIKTEIQQLQQMKQANAALKK